MKNTCLTLKNKTWGREGDLSKFKYLVFDKQDMLRTLKRLVGIWEPREDTIYRPKDIGPYSLHVINGAKYLSIYVEYSLDNVNWKPCTFSLKNGIYEIHAKDYPYGNTKEILLVEKQFVKAKKIKKSYTVTELHVTALKTDIYYRLLIKDPSKIRYLKRQ